MRLARKRAYVESYSMSSAWHRNDYLSKCRHDCSGSRDCQHDCCHPDDTPAAKRQRSESPDIPATVTLQRAESPDPLTLPMSEPDDDDDKYAGLLQLLAQDAEEEEGE